MQGPGFVYFVSVPGKAQARFGSSQFIGARVNRSTGKLEWSPDPVPIGESEHATYRRDYTNAVRRGDLQQVKVEQLDGGGQRVTVLPGGPVPTEKNKLRAANESWTVGVPAPAAAPQQAPAAVVGDSDRKRASGTGH